MKMAFTGMSVCVYVCDLFVSCYVLSLVFYAVCVRECAHNLGIYPKIDVGHGIARLLESVLVNFRSTINLSALRDRALARPIAHNRVGAKIVERFLFLHARSRKDKTTIRLWICVPLVLACEFLAVIVAECIITYMITRCHAQSSAKRSELVSSRSRSSQRGWRLYVNGR